MSLNQPDLDLIADYVGGALEGTPDEQRVSRRIRTDAEWARAYADLMAAIDDVSTDLQALGAEPEPMPAEVWSRLEAALSTAAATAGGDRSPTAYPVFTAPRDNRPPSRTATRRRRWTVPALAAVAVLFALSVGFLAIRQPAQVFDQSTNSGGTADGPAPAAARPPLLQRASGRDYTDQTLVLATDFGAVPLASVAQSEASSGDGAVSKMPQIARSFAAPVPAALAPLTDPAVLARCLDAVTAITPGQVLGVDYATYNHTPAAIIVVRTPDDARWVGVAGADCGNRGAHLLAQKRIA